MAASGISTPVQIQEIAVAYLIRKGTRVLLRKPTGEVVEHVVRQDSTFYRHDQVAELRVVQFKKDGFLLTVTAADITEIRYACPECGCRVEIEGLCQACRQKWMPGR